MLNSYLRLHFVVFIWGFTAILGNLISLDAIPLVLNRMSIAVIVLLIYTLIKKRNLNVEFKNLMKFFGAGLIIAFHWITFFHAIKISNVSVTLACLSSGAFFVSLLEPIFFKRKLVLYEMFLGLLVIVGVATIFAVETKYKWGILTALTSAFMSALFSVINGKLVHKNKPMVITLYELLGGVLGIVIYMLITGNLTMDVIPTSTNDWMYLLILGGVCTAYPFIESVRIMKLLSPFSVVLTINLEPVYGIVMAYFIFGDSEKMEPAFYLGALIILLTVIANALLKRRKTAHQLS